MANTVTPRQLSVLRCILDFRAKRKYSPTLAEIGAHLGVNKVTVFEHVDALKRKGLLVQGGKHRARTLELSERAISAFAFAGTCTMCGRELTPEMTDG